MTVEEAGDIHRARLGIPGEVRMRTGVPWWLPRGRALRRDGAPAGLAVGPGPRLCRRHARLLATAGVPVGATIRPRLSSRDGPVTMPECHDRDVGVDKAVDVFRLAEIVAGALIVVGALNDVTPCRLG